MPWKGIGVTVVDRRVAFVHRVKVCGLSVAAVCREFEISRKTGHKWLLRAAAGEYEDRSRRPKLSPTATSAALTAAILDARDRYHWGARKIKALVTDKGVTLPSIRTVSNVLARHGRIHTSKPETTAPRNFERSAANQLWQCDFKGALEVERRRVFPFAAIDDHSRFAVALRPSLNLSMDSAWNFLWDAFGDYGLPDAILADNAFGTSFPHLPGLSWFESQLLRLDIKPLHGRPYHPQTQGKIERFNGTLERELLPHAPKDQLCRFAAHLQHWRSHVYNAIRPHEALGDQPPITRWRPSTRKRPRVLPPPSYPEGSDIRKVSSGGDVQWRNYRFLAGRGIGGQYVRFEERAHEIAIFYCSKQIRAVPVTELAYGPVL